jgi:hypothetical protein
MAEGGSSLSFNAGAEATRQAANFFRLPYVSVKEIYEEEPMPEGLDRDKLFDGEDVAGNRVHPSPIGHQLYAAGVIRKLREIFSSFQFDFQDTDLINENLAPYPSNPVYIPADKITSCVKDFTLVKMPENARKPLESLKYVLETRSTEASLTIHFVGESAGISFIIENCHGSADVILDGTRLGVWCRNVTGKAEFPGGRFNLLVKELDPIQHHTLEFIPCKQQNLLKDQTFCIQVFGIAINGKFSK